MGGGWCAGLLAHHTHGMCQSIQLVLNTLKVIISVLVDGILVDDTSGLLYLFERFPN